MYYIVETSKQLSQLPYSEKCFIAVVTNNDNYHPLLTAPSLIYYRNSDKGYILPINHSEALSLELQQINSFLAHHKQIYCLDQKATSYFIQDLPLIDINQTILDIENKVIGYECSTKVHTDYYIDQPYLPNLNQIIPIAKHYEKYECLYNQVEKYIGLETNPEFYSEFCKQYQVVEKQGIGVNKSKFDRHFEPTWDLFSIQQNRVFTSYNLYNLTSRPTNAFNGINFLAINKEDGSRKSFIPQNDIFLEFDFDAYHLRLIANLIGYEFKQGESIHNTLGKQYFQTSELSEEQYNESKLKTFQQIYGGIRKEYAHIEFFRKINDFIQAIWLTYQETGNIVLQTGRPLHLPKNSLNPQKLFNYIIQNLETLQNVVILKRLNELLQNTRSKVVLVVYDAFLLDFAIEDGKQLILDIKQVIEEEGFTVKVKVGKDYDSLVRKDYL